MALKKSIALSVSVLNADFLKLGESLKGIDPYADAFHVDIMDGTMTPIISFGTWIIPLLKQIVRTPLEIHLYVRNPEELFVEVMELGAARVLMNQETLSMILESGVVSRKNDIGLYVLPTDSVDTINIDILEHVSLVNVVTVNSLQGGQSISWDLVKKTKWLDTIRRNLDFHFDISIDGGINERVLGKALQFPIDQVIVGSAILASENPVADASKFRNMLTSS
ncbi:MAG: hypothetical protein E4H14_17460 [Candidatus Thorarchaeota archaeon]|nr:MAG: hypothetical protein E4H14_17460 [Candidatus Thorarchaeota archaeon]